MSLHSSTDHFIVISLRDGVETIRGTVDVLIISRLRENTICISYNDMTSNLFIYFYETVTR